MLPFDVVRRLPVSLIVAEPVCLDPDRINTRLRSLTDALEERIRTEAAREMELLRLSGVGRDEFLGPFLDAGFILFAVMQDFVRQVLPFLDETLRLISNGMAAGMAVQGVMRCQSPLRIRTRLDAIRERLFAINGAARNELINFERDVPRIRFLIEQARRAPQPANGTVAQGLRVTSLAERSALMAVRRFRVELAAILQLMREALQEIVPIFGVVPRPRIPLSLAGL